MVRALLLGIVWALLAGAAASAETQPLIVFAAASLRQPLEQLAPDSPAPYVVSPGASGTLARQIEQHAPAALFASADPHWMDYLSQRGLIAPTSRAELARNSLVVIARARQHLRPLVRLQDLPARLGDAHWATADPASAPLGAYAFEALTRLGIADALRASAAFAQDAGAAVELVAHGGARYGIVYATDARLSREVGVELEIPDDLHRPILYEAAAVTKAPSTAAQVLAYWRSAPARRLFMSLGFGRAVDH